MSAKRKEATGKVRPVLKWDSAQEKSSLQGVARVWVNKDTLILLTGGVESGKRCWVERTAPVTSSETTNGVEEAIQGPVRRQGLLASSADRGINPGVVMMTEAYREACALHLGDQVTIKPHDDASVPAATFVEVEPVEAIANEKEALNWEGAIWFSLRRAGHVFPGMRFDCTVATFKRGFCVQKVNSETDNVARFDDTVTDVKICAKAEGGNRSLGTRADAAKKLAVPDIPGLHAEIKELNSFFRGFNGDFYHQGQQCSCGIVIHGGRGTGKTFVLERIAATGWGRVLRIEENDKSSTVEEVFKQARSQTPSIVFIDGLQALIGKDRPNAGTIATKLGQQLDQLAEEAWNGKTLPKVAVIATCLDYMTDVPPELQRETRFELNIPLSIPNAAGRLQILQSICGSVNPQEKEMALRMLSQQTHAYNPSDLRRLVRKAIRIRLERVDPDQHGAGTSADPNMLAKLRGAGEEGEKEAVEAAATTDHYVTTADLEQALRSTRPTAMHDVNLKPPTIQWQDVGGQDSLKRALQRMIRLATSTDPEIRSLIPDPPKGLLLYGPPGCSKTLSAQAMATESGFNFFAVKGAELLNMYVGESERAVRLLFERARSASPSIIFFDEIDSIGGQRAGSGGGANKGRGAASQGSVNMLTTLLTEMDGFEALTGVLILAATNRPEAMDPALLRPGRFDHVVYVGLPDQRGREAIFAMNLRKRRVAPDVSAADLAAMADGFSGAEIKQICSAAANRAVDAWLEGSRREGDTCISMDDFVEAIGATSRGVTQEMVDGYERWAKSFSKQ